MRGHRNLRPGNTRLAGMTEHTQKLQKWLELARTGNVDIRHEIIDHVGERLRLLTRRMMKSYPKVNLWSESDDVLQNALIRLHRSLAEIKPETPRQFYGLATTQIRRELIDLARHFYGAEGIGSNLDASGVGVERLAFAEQDEPETLEAWARYHQQVEQLPDDQKEVVNLLWYEGMSQPDAASVLGISLATVKRRWQAARLTLFENLKDFDFE